MLFRLVPTLIAAVALLPAACAPQSAGMASQAPAASLSGPANAGPTSMDHSGTQSRDMSAMMAHCAQVRQQAGTGMTMSADMRQVIGQCDQMDRSMGMTTSPRVR